MSDEATGIVIVIDLPQPLHKVSDLLSCIGQLWPNTNVNVKPEGAAAQLGNWCIHVGGDDG